jgi:hypothetical protein
VAGLPRQVDDCAEVGLKIEAFILSYRIDGREQEIQFLPVVARRFTDFTVCTREQSSVRNKLVLVEESEWLREDEDLVRQCAEPVHHYRIFFDDVGCHEVLACSVVITAGGPRIERAVSRVLRYGDVGSLRGASRFLAEQHCIGYVTPPVTAGERGTDG